MIRHLVLPNDLAGTEKFVRWVARELSPGTYVNLMAQYHPAHKARDYPELSRRITVEEWEQALPGNWLSRIGIVALFIGLGFLAKLAYDYDWISPIVQLLIGLLIGVVLLWGGQHWNKR